MMGVPAANGSRKLGGYSMSNVRILLLSPTDQSSFILPLSFSILPSGKNTCKAWRCFVVSV